MRNFTEWIGDDVSIFSHNCGEADGGNDAATGAGGVGVHLT